MGLESRLFGKKREKIGVKKFSFLASPFETLSASQPLFLPLFYQRLMIKDGKSCQGMKRKFMEIFRLSSSLRELDILRFSFNTFELRNSALCLFDMLKKSRPELVQFTKNNERWSHWETFWQPTIDNCHWWERECLEFHANLTCWWTWDENSNEHQGKNLSRIINFSCFFSHVRCSILVRQSPTTLVRSTLPSSRG